MLGETRRAMAVSLAAAVTASETVWNLHGLHGLHGLHRRHGSADGITELIAPDRRRVRCSGGHLVTAMLA